MGRELRAIGETLVAIIVTWLLLGWLFDRAFAQADATIQWIPYVRSQLAAGADWTDHLYRFGVLGGSEMHAGGGTLPLVQACALVGLGATATANTLTIFLQLCFGFFGGMLAEGLARRSLTTAERIACVWLCAFAPVVGWRLAYGHENLLLGLLPYAVGIALLSARRVGVAGVALAAFAVANGVSGLGPQTIAYSAIFGLPVAVVAWLAAPRSQRLIAVAVVAGGILVVLPRLAVMYAHQLGDDAGRGLAGALTYSYGAQSAGDWAGSLAWTTAAAPSGPIPLHERNFPLGALVCLAALAWPRHRRLCIALVAAAVVAIGFACEWPPFSLLAHLPALDSFRVPARAILPVLIIVPPLAAAALLGRTAVAAAGSAGDAAVAAPGARRTWWLALGGGAALIAVLHGSVPVVRELAAWLVCGALLVLARWRPALFATRHLVAGLAIVAALGVLAFDERFPRQVPHDRIEHGPAEVRDAVLAGAPELAMPLERVQIVDAPPPFEMSTAFAAGLSTLDGGWYPPRRFLQLLAALTGKDISPTTGVFKLTRSPAFPVLQQLYNVRYIVSLAHGGSLDPLPATPGAAWFTSRLEIVADPAGFARAQHDLATTAFALRDDPQPAPADPACAGAKVTNVATDDLGQTATIAVDSPATCTLIVATNYTSLLRANAPTFPIDVALVGIAVPPGTQTISLGPEVVIPWWSRVLQLIGVAALVLAAVRVLRRSA